MVVMLAPRFSNGFGDFICLCALLEGFQCREIGKLSITVCFCLYIQLSRISMVRVSNMLGRRDNDRREYKGWVGYYRAFSPKDRVFLCKTL